MGAWTYAPVVEPGTNGNHAHVGQVWNKGSTDNNQEILVSVYNLLPEVNDVQPITSPSGGYLVSNVHVGSSKRIRKSPQRYDPGFGTARECNSDDIAILVYMIRDGGYDINVDRDDIL